LKFPPGVPSMGELQTVEKKKNFDLEAKVGRKKRSGGGKKKKMRP